MYLKRMFFYLLTGFSYLFFTTPDALACTCELPRPGTTLKQAVTQARDKSKAVFSGEVLEIIRYPKSLSLEVKFRVENSWKQVRTNQVVIHTGRGGGDCGYQFEIGERYLIYAYLSNKTALATD